MQILGIAAATLWTSVLPSVKQIKPESKTQKMNVIYDGIEAKNDEPINIQEVRKNYNTFT